MKSDHEITRILCSRLDKRKAHLHANGGDHTFDTRCNLYRDAIKDMWHPYRMELKDEFHNKAAAKKQKRRAMRAKKQKSAKRYKRHRPAVKRNTPRTTQWVSRDEWLKESDIFYASRAWKEVRYFVLRRDGAVCCCCGARASDGLCMHVDHIKPRSVYPELQLDPYNMQVLCDDCNQGKSNYYSDDWRVKMA